MLLFVCPGSKPISLRAKAQISVISSLPAAYPLPFPVTNSCSPYLGAPPPFSWAASASRLLWHTCLKAGLSCVLVQEIFPLQGCMALLFLSADLCFIVALSSY